MPISNLRRAIHVFRGRDLNRDLKKELAQKTSEIAKLKRELAYEKSERQRAHRRAEEYLNVVDRLQTQRNEWRELFHEQSRAHVTAQAIMGKAIARTRKVAARAIVELNKYREEKGLGPAKQSEDLQPYDGEPCGVAKRYGEEMKRLHDSMPVSLKGRVLLRDVDKALGFKHLERNTEEVPETVQGD